MAILAGAFMGSSAAATSGQANRVRGNGQGRGRPDYPARGDGRPWRSFATDAAAAPPPARLTHDLRGREIETDLELGIVDAVGTVHRVALDAFGKGLADRAWPGLGR